MHFASLRVVLLLILLTPPGAGAENPIERHMRRMLTDGDQWRTDNPHYDPEQGGPQQFGLRLELQPDKVHVVGNLTGVFADGREAVYWTLLALYNPVTEKVVTQQVGWDGTLIYGEVPLQKGDRQVVDMVSYGTDGQMSISRHENLFEETESHTSIVYERGPDGWSQTQEWVWERHAMSEILLAARI